MNIFADMHKTQKSIHFIGVGGDGMAPLASIAFEQGFLVSGSDERDSQTIKELQEKGVKINIGHKESNVGDVDLVVYSIAIREDNSEMKAAKEKNIVTVRRSKFLGYVTEQFSKLIAVAGTHGKSTTSSMCTQILVNSGRDPTSIIGVKSRINGKNYSFGKSEYGVCEACEFGDSFLDIESNIAVILNIDDDHLDYFENIEKEKESFKKFAKKCKRTLIVNAQDYNATETVNDINLDKIFYAIGKKGNFKTPSFFAENLIVNEFGCFEFDIVSLISNKNLRLKLQVPGIHNVSNALAAAAACEKLGVNLEEIKESLEKFTGTSRRFEKLGTACGVTIIDDYAHHPTELHALFNTISNLKHNGEIWIIFQPHTFSRTSILFDDFVKILSKFSNVILAPIFASREKYNSNISSEKLAKEIKTCKFVGKFKEISEFILRNVNEGDLVFTVGAGNINECGKMILESLKKSTDVNHY